MTVRQSVLLVTILIIGLLGGYLIGVTRGIVLERDRRANNPPAELWQIDPDFRREDVDSMFADYDGGRLLYTHSLPVFGKRLRVRVVRRYRGGDYGFVPLRELGDVPDRFWYSMLGKFEIKQYNNDNLFVVII
jgi:hypothetical protein